MEEPPILEICLSIYQQFHRGSTLECAPQAREKEKDPEFNALYAEIRDECTAAAATVTQTRDSRDDTRRQFYGGGYIEIIRHAMNIAFPTATAAGAAAAFLKYLQPILLQWMKKDGMRGINIKTKNASITVKGDNDVQKVLLILERLDEKSAAEGPPPAAKKPASRRTRKT
jgi:hypothetical protein